MSLHANYTDQELTVLLSEGDERAFAEIYRRNWQSLYNAAYRRMKDEQQCEDIIQNVFSDLWERKESTHIENIAAYLHTAVRYQVIKQSTRSPQTSEFIDSFDSLLVSPVRTDDTMLENEVLDLVRQWISILPEKRRAIFLMHYYQDMSTSEIAADLGVSQKTVQNQLNTAGNALRDKLSHILTILLVASFFIFQ